MRMRGRENEKENMTIVFACCHCQRCRLCRRCWIYAVDGLYEFFHTSANVIAE